MTAPNYPGYPDWQAQANFRSNAMQSGTIVVPGSSTITLGPFPAYNAAALGLTVLPNTFGLFVHVVQNDSTTGLPIGLSPAWIATYHTGLTTTVPLIGNQVSVTLQNFAASSVSATVYVLLVNNNVGRIEYPHSQGSITVSGQTLLPSSQQIYYPPLLRPGFFTASCNPYDNSGQLSYLVTEQRADATAGVSVIESKNFTSRSWNQVFLDERPWSLIVVNNDAVNSHSFDAALVSADR